MRARSQYKPVVRRITISHKEARCPICGGAGTRHCTARRRLYEIGHNGPTVIEVTYSKHFCTWCDRYFCINMDYLAPAYCHYTHRVRRAAVEMLIAGGVTLQVAAKRMRQKYFVRIPPTTLHDWAVGTYTA